MEANMLFGSTFLKISITGISDRLILMTLAKWRFTSQTNSRNLSKNFLLYIDGSMLCR